MAIGIFDSGLGGLSILQAARQALPDASFVYLGDNAHAPYGTRAPQDIIQRTEQATHVLWEHDCDLVVLACNTASAIALRPLQSQPLPDNKRVLGVFVPMIEALTGRDWGDTSPPVQAPIQRVALFATPATVASQAFERELNLRATGIQVQAQACHGLVDAIEANDPDEIHARVQAHCQALLEAMPNPQAAVLGCTHYPLVADQFRAALGPAVRIISQPDLVAASLADYLFRHGLHETGGTLSCLTTGDPLIVSRQASQFMGQSLTFQKAH